MSAATPVLEPVETSTRSRGRLGRFAGRVARRLRGVFKLAVGCLLCVHYLGGLIVVGWTARLTRRGVLHGWWSASPVRDELEFEAFALAQGGDVPPTTLPNWVLGERIARSIGRTSPTGGPPGRLRRLIRLPSALLGSLGRNLGRGTGILLATYALTGPACLLWLGSWYDGWNNSFHKGYEQAAVGPLTGILGTVLFIAAMTYVPMAWAHAATTGDPRSFFEFGFVRRLVRCRPIAMTFYAAAFALAHLPIAVLKITPLILVGNDPSLEEASPERITAILWQLNLASAVVVFPIFVGVHLLAGRIYRGAVLALLRRDPAQVARLNPSLIRAFGTLELLPATPPRRSHPVVAVVLGTGRWGTDLVLRVATLLLWFAVVAQLFVAEFLVYHPFTGWVVQPLVHLPSLFTWPAG